MLAEEDVIGEIEEHLLAPQLKELRKFFRARLRFSHNYSLRELRIEREVKTIELGKKLLPGLSDERILELARIFLEGEEEDEEDPYGDPY